MIAGVLVTLAVTLCLAELRQFVRVRSRFQRIQRARDARNAQAES